MTKVTKIPSLEISGNGRNLLSTRPNTPPEQPTNPRDPKAPPNVNPKIEKCKWGLLKEKIEKTAHHNTAITPSPVPPNINVQISPQKNAQYKPKCLPKKPKVKKMPKEGISLLNWMKNGQNHHKKNPEKYHHNLCEQPQSTTPAENNAWKKTLVEEPRKQQNGRKYQHCRKWKEVSNTKEGKFEVMEYVELGLELTSRIYPARKRMMSTVTGNITDGTNCAGNVKNMIEKFTYNLKRGNQETRKEHKMLMFVNCDDTDQEMISCKETKCFNVMTECDRFEVERNSKQARIGNVVDDRKLTPRKSMSRKLPLNDRKRKPSTTGNLGISPGGKILKKASTSRKSVRQMVASIELPSQVRHIYPTNPFATQAGVQVCTTPMRDEDEVGGTDGNRVHQQELRR